MGYLSTNCDDQPFGGRIINISSVHGLVASVNKSAYVAAKHGVVGFSKTVALETAGFNQAKTELTVDRLWHHMQLHQPWLGKDAIGGEADCCQSRAEANFPDSSV
jgi:hypothetical protein